MSFHVNVYNYNLFLCPQNKGLKSNQIVFKWDNQTENSTESKISKNTEKTLKTITKCWVYFSDASVQILATSPLREFPQMVVIVRESPPKVPEAFRFWNLVIFPEIQFAELAPKR